jgi:hypothetical protein
MQKGNIMSAPIINIVKARMLAVNKELNELRLKVTEKEKELELIRLALSAMRFDIKGDKVN